MKTLAMKNPSTVPNLLFVAIDFEGNMEEGGKGIGELGISTFHTKSMVHVPVIETKHFSLRAHRHRKFCFGQTTRTHAELLPGLITSYLTQLRQEMEGQIVLVCHGLQNELRILDGLGVYLEDLHITGVLDTYEVARSSGMRAKGTLQDMLDEARVPYRLGSLHCAGNDACYTLKLVLGSLQGKFGDPFERLEEVVRGAVPEPPSWKDKEGDEQLEEGWECIAEDGLLLLEEP